MNDKKCIPLGDKHGGQQVSLVTEGETKYLIKPRVACAEKGLEAFLLKLEQKGFPFLPACEHIIGETKGGIKTAFVEHLPAESAADVALYFKRCGALIFLAYLFGSNDLHFENIIASKNTPVLVDCETLMNGKTEADVGELKNLTSTVMKSHLMPNWRLDGDEAKLTAGLISDHPDAKNHLIFGGECCYIYDYVDDVLCGFCAAYDFALNNGDVITSALKCFEGSSFRFLLRPTEVYAKIIELAKKLDDEKRESTVRLLLSAAYARDKRENRIDVMAAVLDEEVAAVLNGDIPYFYIYYSRHGLHGAGRELAGDFLCEAPEKCVIDRLRMLNSNDKSAQCKIIMQSVAAARPIEKRVSTPVKGDIFTAMFEKLEDGYISAISSGFTQLTTGADGNLYFQSAGFGLYDGLAGILCAYAALYKKTNNQKIMAALKSHCEPLGEYIANSNGFALNGGSVSLQSGVSGVIACLVHIYELTGDRQFYSDAVTLAKKLRCELEGDINLDLLGGLAGLALQLPKLPCEVSAPLKDVILPKLLEYEPKLTGAAHGAVGVALAIAALSDGKHDDKILELLEFEEQNYFDNEHNWRDLRALDRVAFMHGWCSGVGGEAMIRQRLYSLTENEKIKAICRRDLERAKVNLLSDFTVKRDCLCCGNAARLMAISNINEKNSRLYTLLCDRIKDDSVVLLHPCDTDDRDFGLMQGLAGVIYAVAMYGDEKSGGMLLC
ncbi:MAG: DUF4135 domain-containing protein [Eubacterium sp.]|nr:DUF4135 domain-containing protein [Eubacterium sp.]